MGQAPSHILPLVPTGYGTSIIALGAHATWRVPQYFPKVSAYRKDTSRNIDKSRRNVGRFRWSRSDCFTCAV